MWERDWRIVLAEMAQQIEDLQTRVETLTQEQALLRAALLELTGEAQGVAARAPVSGDAGVWTGATVHPSVG